MAEQRAQIAFSESAFADLLPQFQLQSAILHPALKKASIKAQPMEQRNSN